MKQTHLQPASDGAIDRRRFCAVTGIAALATLTVPRAEAAISAHGENMTTTRSQTGNGEWTYEVASGWGQLPAGLTFGGTHGAIATDHAGHVYVSTQSETGILVYTPEGVFKEKIAGRISRSSFDLSCAGRR